MKGIKICDRCAKKILPDQKGVCLHTFKGEQSLEKVFWHYNCYLDWINERLEHRATELYNRSLQAAMPQLSSMMKKILPKEIFPQDLPDAY